MNIPTRFNPAPTLITKEDWQRFVDTPRSTLPPRHTRTHVAKMRPAERERWNGERIRHHASFGPISTPQMEEIHEHLWRQVNLNFNRPGAGAGTIIDGLGNSGKTTIIIEFGRRYELTLRSRYSSELTAGGDEFIPVVYVTLPAETTIKGLNLALAEFYGAPYHQRATKDELSVMIQRVARRCATSVFLIDDIHFLDFRDKDHRKLNDHLKYLANTISATFIYAGIGCTQGGLLNEGGSPTFSQTRKRFSLIPVEPFTIDTGGGRRTWASLLEGIEDELVLFDAHPGMLSRTLAGYLYERSGGYIGPLMSLIRQGANLAIERASGTRAKEVISESLLEGITIDWDHEETRPRWRNRRRRGGHVDPEADAGGGQAA